MKEYYHTDIINLLTGHVHQLTQWYIQNLSLARLNLPLLIKVAVLIGSIAHRNFIDLYRCWNSKPFQQSISSCLKDLGSSSTADFSMYNKIKSQKESPHGFVIYDCLICKDARVTFLLLTCYFVV